MMTRRKFLTGIGLLGLAGVATPAYARYVEPRWLRTSLHEVPLRHPGLHQPLRLLHLSDFHLSDVVPLDYLADAVTLGLRSKPDLVCMTGDFTTGHLRQEKAYAALLNRCVSAAPTFATLGNHDGGEWTRGHGGYPTSSAVRHLLGQSGITCLHNASRTLTLRGQTLTLVGMGDLWAGEFHPEAAFEAVPARPGHPVLALSHNPDTKEDLRVFPWDLLLCGHTHGGQFQLPLVGAPFAPVQDHRFVDGLYTWEGRHLHVTRGVGNVGGVRFNCRPEVSVLDLVRK